MDEKGMAGSLKNVEWESVDMATVPQEDMDKWEEAWSKFFLKHTKEELFREATKRQFLLLPCNTCADVMEDEQLAARDYWMKVHHDELGAEITYPGAPYKLSLTPWRIQRRAPMIGEHNKEIYQEELGLSTDKLILLRQAGII